ncbi:MAG: Gfo/Idh/MocA family oxidoreductase [bacterium]|nr:Gfo/Idh/MocA family oxidoreductase [bacterium]
MKVGIIGAGRIGNKRAEIISMAGDTLVAAADIDPAKARRLADAYKGTSTSQWMDVVDNKDIETVVVSTSNDMLCKITVAALEKGKHVLCEKPLGRNFKEAKQIYRASQRSKGLLMTGFNHRFYPAVTRARELVCSRAAVGEILHIRAVYGHGGRKGFDTEWPMDIEKAGGGELTYQGVHVLDLFRWFLGEFHEASGFNENTFWKNSPRLEDSSYVLLKTKQGQVASAHFSITEWKKKFLFEIFGTEGYVIIDGLSNKYGDRERVIHGKREAIGKKPREQVFDFPYEDTSWERQWKEFTDAVRQKREPLGNGYDGMKANELIAMLYASSKKKKVIRF